MQTTGGGVDIRNPPIYDGNQLPAGQGPADPRAPSMPTNLTKQEQDIIKQCRDEAYWYRSLPLSAVLGAGTMYAVKAGMLSASQKGGPWPKAIFAATIGYVAGKMSYASVCQEKFVREAPDSSIGRAIRKARGEDVPQVVQDVNPQLSHEEGLFSDGKDTINTGGDTGYSDYFSNSPTDSKTSGEGQGSPVLGTLTYDQLRAQHRQKEMERPYMQQGALIKPSTPVDPKNTITPPAPYSPQPPVSTLSPPEYNPPTPTRKRTNKYGDEVFE